MSDRTYLATIEEVIEEARNGRMFVLVDDESRENEGDLVIPAQMATPDAINFMAKHGRGLICLALTSERVQQLGLTLMSRRNQSRLQTAFTVSIEAKEGITTGISASDRARTIAVAVDPTKDADDIVTPGHVFPLIARTGGVLVRAGHTEAAVDVARLAGLNPAGVICEIMREDGSMARLPDLVGFAQRHNLKVATIADLIAYRLRHDSLVERTAESTIESRFGGTFKTIVFINKAAHAEHLALVKGDIRGGGPVLVRVHALSIFRDLLGDRHINRTGQLQQAMRLIGEEGRGAVVLIREPWINPLVDIERQLSDEPDLRSSQLREYGVGAQILLDLGVRDMILLSNSARNIVGLEGYGLRIVERRPIPVEED